MGGGTVSGGRLTASDPEPPPGTLVRDDCGTMWENDGHPPCCWVQPDADVHDPETWRKIAGSYGPVVVIEWGDGDRCSECGDPTKPGYRYSRCCAAPVVAGEGEGA
jgi:hypothetical protein